MVPVLRSTEIGQKYVVRIAALNYEDYCSDNSKKYIFRLLANLRRQLGQNISATTRRKIVWLFCLQHRWLHLCQLRLITLGGSPSRIHANYRQRSGARHQLDPECGKLPSRPTISSTSATRQSHQRSGAQQQLRLRSWLWFYDNNSTTSSSTTPRRPRRIT
jgi:hypothetical protein